MSTERSTDEAFSLEDKVNHIEVEREFKSQPTVGARRSVPQTATSTKIFADSIIKSQGLRVNYRYIYFEPLLEWSWNKTYQEPLETVLKAEGIGQVIIGAQTKPTIMPKIEWVQEIVQACDKAGIPVFLKDNLMPLLPYSWFRDKPSADWAYSWRGILRQEVPK